VRSCECLPENDCKYFGSFKDKTFAPTNKIILLTFATREEANVAEVALHALYEVHINPHFANIARQTSSKFDCGGIPKSESHKNNISAALLKFQVNDPIRHEQNCAAQSERMKQNRAANPEFFKAISQRNMQSLQQWLEQNPEAKKLKEEKSGAVLKQYYAEHKSEVQEKMQEHNKKLYANLWQCTITGKISTKNGLSRYQNNRGIDTSNRVRLTESLEQPSGGYTSTKDNKQT